MGATTLKVTRVWETMLSRSADASGDIAIAEWLELDDGAEMADLAVEMAGRACYQSWHKPNPDTVTNDGYVRHVLDVEHFSLFGHPFVGYYIEGISRSLTHELIRHRFPTFSQLSQRYVRLAEELPYVVPPLCQGVRDAEVLLRSAARESLEFYQRLETVLIDAHPQAKPKEIREAARAVLPGMTETKVVVTANLRAWRDLLEQRIPKTADAEIRVLASELLTDLKRVAPASFSDIELS